MAATFCAVVVGMAGCTRDDPLAPPSHGGPSFDLYVPPPGECGRICTGYLPGQTFGGNWWEMGGPMCRTELEISPGTAVYEDPYTGPYDINVTFSEPVSNLVVTPFSIWRCGGNPGSVTVYSAAGESASFPFTTDETECGKKMEVYPGSQCGPWWIQTGAGTQATVVDVPQVTRLVIHPPSPLRWITTVYEPDGNCGFNGIDVESIGGGTYLLSFREFALDENLDLVVSCDRTSVVRAEAIDCVARPVPPAATLTILEWRFDSPLGFSAVRPTAEGGRSWGGPIATAGTMSLTARVSTRTFTRTVDIDVIQRNWTDRPIPFDIQEETNNHLPLMVREDHDLGDVHQTLVDRYEAVTEVIANGPNQGLAYITDIPFVHQARIHINRQALAQGSAFSKRHPVANPQGGLCTRSYLEQQIPPLALRHEGLQMEPNSHTWFYQHGIEQQNLGPAVESLVGYGFISNETRNSVSDVLKAAHTVAAAQDQADEINKVNLTCRLNYFK